MPPYTVPFHLTDVMDLKSSDVSPILMANVLRHSSLFSSIGTHNQRTHFHAFRL
jgi:hypothetical protein